MGANKSVICHECGSSVEGGEAFCPYCGISLSTGAAEPVDDSMESTIMISPEEADALAKQSLASAESETPETGLPVPENGPQVENLPVESIQEDKIDIESVPAIDDIPPPAILSDFGRTEGNMQPSSTSEYSAEEIEQSAETKTPEAAEPSADPAAESLVPANSDAAEAADEPAADLVDTMISMSGSAFSTPVSAPEIESPIPEASQQEIEASSVEPDEKPSGSAEVSDDDIPSPAILSDGIEKPMDDLSSFDSYQSQSMFDSVRIMEPGTADRNENIETQLHPGYQSVDDVPKPVDQISEEPSAADGAISSTSNSIGGGETDGKRNAKLKPLAEGTILNGRYEIIRKIGGGGMGAVYLASDNNLGGVLRAVKEMVQTHIEEEQQEKAINDFKRESMILSSLDHVSIPTIYDYFYDEKECRFYLVMKYISGGDLSSRLRSAPEGRVDEKSVCEWAVQIIDVLDYLHNQPSTIVYRDLKPSNIMIDGNSGRAMLIDFGIARSISQKEQKGVTAVGTMGYAPPELFSGNVEPRSDIYSLGSTMFHLVTGADPQSNPLLIFDFQKNPRPRQLNPQLSDQIERLIMKAVQYNADERFHSAAEMRDVLEDHLLKLKAGIVTYGVSEVPTSVSLSNQSVFCGFCGQRIVATDMFCAFCGAKQPIAQQGVHAEIYSQTAFTAKLVIEGTSELNAPAFSLQKDDNLLGRRDPMSNIFPEVDLSKYDPQTKISRRHARIWRDGNNFLVEDLGSSNGTILSRTMAESFRLPPNQPQVLSAGDRIRLGDATLHFILG